MPPYSRSRLKYVYPRVHIANPDNLINIHIIVATNAGQFIGKSYVHSSESILNHLCHFSGSNICHYDLTLTEARIILPDAFTYLVAISTYCTIVMKKLVDHITWDNTLRGMYQMNIFAYR